MSVADSSNQPLNIQVFDATYGKITESLTTLSLIVEKGASHSVLTAGLVTLSVAMALEVISMLSSFFLSGRLLTDTDLAILLCGSIFFMFFGCVLRLLDRYLIRDAEERIIRLRMEAADKAAAFAKGIVPDISSKHDIL